MTDDAPSRLTLLTRHAAPKPASEKRTTLQIAMDSARRVLKRRFRVLLLVRNAYTRMSRHASAVKSVKEDLGLLLRLMKAWALRTYQRVPWGPLLLIAGAVVYFVAPVDLIPDALIGIGFVDDVAVISAVVKAVRDELDQFRRWEKHQLKEPPASANRTLSAS